MFYFIPIDMLYTTDQLEDSTISYLPSQPRFGSLLYLLLLGGIITALTLLPFIYTDISVKATGITRPISERTEVHPFLAGIIDTIYYREGTVVARGAVILRMKDNTTASKKEFNDFGIGQRKQFIHDLLLLTSDPVLNDLTLNQLSSPLYKEQLSRFLHQKADNEASLTQANKDLEMNTTLAKEKVISPKEFFDIQITQQKAEAADKAFIREQLSNWQQDLARYQLELSQYRDDLAQVKTNASYYEIRAPVAGVIQGIAAHYTGGMIRPDEAICTISPNGSLVGECYVSTADIGLVRLGQPVRLQVEAFNYNYFGSLTGRVASIDNDFTVVNDKPVFKVRCSLDSTQLRLKNGFAGHLKKGLTFQVRFLVGRRNLWQLLFDRIDDWLNPSAPDKPVQQ